MQRLNTFLNLLGLACGVAWAPMAVFSAPAGADAVAVFLSATDDQVHISTLEFFRAVGDEIAQGKSWSMVDGTEMRKVATVNGLKFLGRVPVLPRSMLIKAHPEVASYDQPKKTAAASMPGRQKIIPQIQETLDTLAVQGAIIVDCQQTAGGRLAAPDSSAKSGSKLRGCGLYYYDRAAGKVVAASRKSFRVGVTVANKWAPTMVDGLKSGLDAHKAKQDQDRLTSIVEKSDEQEGPARPYLAVGLIGESLRMRSGEAANLAGATAGVGAAYAGRSLGVEYAQASYRGERTMARDLYESRAAGLVFGVTAEAMDIVTWGLDITAGIAERRYVREDEEVLRARQPLIGVRPGIFWNVRRSWLIGVTVSYRASYGGEEKVVASVGQAESTGFQSGSWLTGIGTRVEF